jgi:hypothetical protein
MTRKFKLNDEVVIVENTGDSCNRTGDIGKVVEVEPEDYPGDLTYRVYVPSRGTSGNWHAEQDLELTTDKTNVMTDYKKVGTVLPKIPHGIEYRAVRWDSTEPNSTLTGGFGEDRIVSYGSKDFNGETYILADTPGYTSNNYYMFKESTILELAKGNEGKLIGYKLIKEEYREAAIKIALREEKDFIKDSSIHFTHNCRSRERLEEAGVLNLWFEPVYEKKEVIITDNQDREAKVVKGKLLVADGELSLEDLKRIRNRFDDDVVGSNKWRIGLVYATFDIGCWSGVTLEDINKAIEAIESF